MNPNGGGDDEERSGFTRAEEDAEDFGLMRSDVEGQLLRENPLLVFYVDNTESDETTIFSDVSEQESSNWEFSQPILSMRESGNALQPLGESELNNDVSQQQPQTLPNQSQQSEHQTVEISSKRAAVPLSPRQKRILENEFAKAKYLNADQVKNISRELGLTKDRIRNWFKRQRAKLGKEQDVDIRRSLRNHETSLPISTTSSSTSSSLASPQQLSSYVGASSSQYHSPLPNRATEQALSDQNPPQQRQSTSHRYLIVRNPLNATTQILRVTGLDITTNHSASGTSTVPEAALPINVLPNVTFVAQQIEMPGNSGVQQNNASGYQQINLSSTTNVEQMSSQEDSESEEKL